MVFEALADSFVYIISATGYFGIFLLMAWESMILPIPSELVMSFAGLAAARGNFDFVLVVVAATLGSLVGSFASYYAGKYFGRDFIANHGDAVGLKRKHLRRVEGFFEKYGHSAVFIGRFVPVIRHLISIPAGMSNMPPLKFAGMTIAGAGIWNFFLAYFGFALHGHYDLILAHREILDVLGAVLVLMFVVYIGARYWRR